MTVFFLGVFEIGRLNIFSLKVSQPPLLFLICTGSVMSALSHFSQHTTPLPMFREELQMEQRYVCAKVFRSIETTFPFTVFSYKKPMTLSFKCT